MDIDALEHQIKCRESWIKAIEERLPYADGMAYSQDKSRMLAYQNEINTMRRKIDNLKSGGQNAQNRQQVP